MDEHLKVFYQFFSPDGGDGGGDGGDGGGDGDGGNGGEKTMLFVKDDTGAYSEYTPPSFIDSIPEEHRGRFEGIESADQLVEKYLDISGKVPEVPESPDAYDMKYPEELGYTAEDMTAIKTGLHQLGLTAEQVKGLSELDNKLTSERLEAAKAAAAELVTKEETELKKEQGDQFDAFIEQANSGLALLDKRVPGFKELVDNTFAGGTTLTARKAFKEVMALIGSKANENTFLQSGGKGPEERPVGPDGRPRLQYDSMESG
jgi:hypothetical protein